MMQKIATCENEGSITGQSGSGLRSIPFSITICANCKNIGLRVYALISYRGQSQDFQSLNLLHLGLFVALP